MSYFQNLPLNLFTRYHKKTKEMCPRGISRVKGNDIDSVVFVMIHVASEILSIK